MTPVLFGCFNAALFLSAHLVEKLPPAPVSSDPVKRRCLWYCAQIKVKKVDIVLKVY
jgi:hypothetical protein